MVISLLRLVIPTSAATVITAGVMLPVALNAGISPWVVGFAILNLVEFWFSPINAHIICNSTSLWRLAASVVKVVSC